MHYAGVHHQSVPARIGGFLSGLFEVVVLAWLMRVGVQRIHSLDGLLWSTGELVLGLAVAVVFHESGHLVVGLAVGEPVRKMRVGSGPTVVGFHVGSVAVQLCANPLGGGAVYFSEVGRVPEAKRLASVMAGPGMNALSFAYGLALYNLGVEWLGAFVVANVICFVTSAMPASGTEGGFRYASDGLQVLRILLNRSKSHSGFEGAEMTEDARDVVVRAIEEAELEGSGELTDEHVLRALAKDSVVGPLFESVGLSERIPPERNAADDRLVRPRWTKAANSFLTTSFRKAREMGVSRPNAAGLAIGLLSTECASSKLMKEAGITEEMLRQPAAVGVEDEESRHRDLVVSADLQLERWGTAADKVVSYAYRLAQVDHADFVGTQHIIAAVVADPKCRGAQALEHLGFELQSKPDETGEDWDRSEVGLILSPQAVLGLAGAIWRTGPHYPTGTAEVCLGILDQDAGLGAQVLASAGVSSDSLIRALRLTEREPSEQTGCTAAARGLWMARGMARLNSSRWLEARQDFLDTDRLATTDRQHALSRNNAAWAALLSADPSLRAEALELARSAVATMPDEPAFKGTLAFALLENGSTSEAVAMLEPIAWIRPRLQDRASDLCMLTMGYARLERIEEAGKALVAAVAADPKCPLLERARGSLEKPRAAIA